MLWEAGAPVARREAVCRLIAVHQVPFFAFADSRRGVSPEFMVRELSWQVDLHLLVLLARADIRGRICPDVGNVLVNIELFRELALEEGCLRKPRSFASAETAVRYFRGAELHPDYALHEEPGSRVIVMCGLPASGKNHWVAQHHAGLPVVSFDDARTELGLRHGENEGAAAHHAVDKAKSLLRAKAALSGMPRICPGRCAARRWTCAWPMARRWSWCIWRQAGPPCWRATASATPRSAMPHCWACCTDGRCPCRPRRMGCNCWSTSSPRKNEKEKGPGSFQALFWGSQWRAQGCCMACG
jgi:hypothetical protein